MKLKSTYAFVFNRKKEKKGEKSIELFIYFSDGVKMYIATGIKVEDKYWDEKEKKVKKSHPLSYEHNDFLNNLKTRIIEHENDCAKKGKKFDRNSVKSFLHPEKKTEDFLKFCKEYNRKEWQKKNITYQTWQKYNASINVFERLTSEYVKGKGVTFDNLKDYYFIENLEIEIFKHYNDNAGNKFITNINKFIRAAIELGKVDSKYIINIKKHKVKTASRCNLAANELEKMENIDTSKLSETDIWTLDRFLFSCYTGLRISDNSLLTKNNIIDSENGLVIDIVTEKGKGQRVIIPIDVMFAGKAGKIARRYMEKYPDIDTLFPALSDQKINKHLKKIAEMAGITNELTFHVARHTCASLLAEKTANPFVVMKILGHSDIDTSMIYIHNSQAGILKSLQGTEW